MHKTVYFNYQIQTRMFFRWHVKCTCDYWPSAFVRHTIRDNTEYMSLSRNVGDWLKCWAVWLKVLFTGLKILVFANLHYHSPNLGSLLFSLSQKFNAFLSTPPHIPCILVILKMACKCLLCPDEGKNKCEVHFCWNFKVKGLANVHSFVTKF